MIKERVINHEPGLYLALIFPIAFSFTLSFAIARLVSHVAPEFFIQWAPGLHVHHFTYGFFILAIAGYLSMIYNSPKSKFWIALLYGLGLGLAMDEFGMWLRFRDDDVARWSYDGLNFAIGILFFLLALRPGIKLLSILWPFKNPKEPEKAIIDSQNQV